MIRITFSSDFDKQYRTLVEEKNTLRETVLEKIQWFCKNPSDTRLENHSLKKRMRGKWAFSITDDIRIIYLWRGKNTARFLAIGSHEEVYQNRPS